MTCLTRLHIVFIPPSLASVLIEIFPNIELMIDGLFSLFAVLVTVIVIYIVSLLIKCVLFPLIGLVEFVPYY